VAPSIGEKSIHRLLLNSSTWSYPVALELVLHSAIVTDFAMVRLPDPFSCPLLPFMQPKLLQTVASVLRRSNSLALPPEGPDSVRVTFSRRSPQCRPLDPSKSGAIARETGLELFPSVRTEWQTITHLTGHTNGVALIGEKSIHRLFYPRRP
jgi:hypothetical protein